MREPGYIDEREELRCSVNDQSFVQYRMVELDGRHTSHASPLNDLSLSGLKLICYEPIPIGQVLQMDVFLSGRQNPLHLTGEIRWCLEVDEIPTYHAGVSFIKDGSRDFEQWRDVVSKVHA